MVCKGQNLKFIEVKKDSTQVVHKPQLNQGMVGTRNLHEKHEAKDKKNEDKGDRSLRG